MTWRILDNRSIFLTSLVLLLSITSPSIHAAGVNWSWANPLPQGNNLQDIVVSPGLYVAVGDHGTVLTSPDATAWTSETSGTTNNLWGIAWDDAQYVAVGDGGTVLTSPDAATWTDRTSATTLP